MIERREYVVAAVQADVSSEGCVNGIHFEVENSPVDTRRRREEEEVKVEQEESTVYKAFVTRGNKPVICFYVKVCHPVKSIELFQRPDSEWGIGNKWRHVEESSFVLEAMFEIDEPKLGRKRGEYGMNKEEVEEM